MIHPYELRIGNWLYWNEKHLHPNVTVPPMAVEVSAILPDKIGYVQPHREYRVEFFDDTLLAKEPHYLQYDELRPIPLTEEWLMKFRFVKKKKENYFIGNEGKDGIEMKNTGSGFICEISPQPAQYVHQLQNLYFVLTGKELEIIE